MKAVILAGGMGERLRPMTCTRPKPLVNFMQGVVLDGVISNLKSAGVDKAIITSMYISDMLAFYAKSCNIIPIECIKEEYKLGTGGAVANCAHMLNDTFVVVSGDCITDVSISQAISRHKSSGAMATMVLIKPDDPRSFGVVRLDGEGYVQSITEKPQWSEVDSPYCNAGIYIFEPSVFKYLKQGIESDFSMDVFPAMLEAGERVAGCVLDGYWCDIGDEEKYRQAQFDILDGKCKLYTPDSDGNFIGKNVRIDRGVRIIPPVCIADNTVIQGKCTIGSHTVIGKECKIISSEISGSIIWDSVTATDCEIRDSVICSSTTLLPGSRVGVGCVIGEGCKIGRFALVESGCKLWSNIEVEDETAIRFDQRRPAKVTRPDASKLRNNQAAADRVILIAQAVADGKRCIAVTCDGTPLAQAMASIACGAVAMVGGQAINCMSGGMGQAAFAVRYMEADGGIYIASQNSCISITVLGKNGLELNAREKGALTRNMLVGSFDIIGGEVCSKEITSKYYRYILDSVSVRGQGKTIALCGNERAVFYAADALRHTGWNPVAVHDKSIERVIREKGCAFGIKLTATFGVGGLYDQNGKKVNYEQFIHLRNLLCIQAGATKLVLPCDCSRKCLELLNKSCCAVYAVGNSSAEVARQTYDIYQSPKYSDCITDAVIFCLHLCKYLSAKRMLLSYCLEELPYSVEAAVRCPNHKKGRVMQSVREKKLGVRVVPDDSLAVLRIYASDLSKEYARELAMDATEVINEIVMHGQS